VTEEAVGAETLDADAAGADDAGGNGWWLVGPVVVAAAVAGFVAWRNRRGGAGT
jgi:hypothetical protein